MTRQSDPFLNCGAPRLHKALTRYVDFTLALMAGLAILYGVTFAAAAQSMHSPFDMKVAVACFIVAVACIALASGKLMVAGCAIMVPAAFGQYHVMLKGTWQEWLFYLGSMAAGYAAILVGTLTRELWLLQRSPQRGKSTLH